MAEVLVRFDATVSDAEGRAYVARVCGRETEDRLWEGWIEFDPQDGGPALRTPRETTQPNRTDLEYWATGLTMAYLEGALQRALHPQTPDLAPRTVAARPAYDRPAPVEAGRTAAPSRVRPDAVLDPFAVYAQGEEVLREELGALDEGHLCDVVRAHDLVAEEEVDLRAMHRTALAEMIVAAVRRRAG
ncbi:MAG TPA: hypothetical protein VGR37_10565 [Longimicrobiaceae bacterium]|nr:hypothetical protein [Longimicrobiaceae bacterium]